MIYIASPYSSPIEGAQQLRFEKTRRFLVQCLLEGVPAFSPIVYLHDIAKFNGLPTDAAFWHNFNSSFLRHAEAVFVYTLPGWKDSKGVSMEIKQAKIMRIPTTYWNEDGSPNGEIVD